MKTKFYGLLLFSSLIFVSCKKDKEEQPVIIPSGYPESVENIIVQKCANAGCHNTESKDGAAGLDLSTWDKLFEGGRNGPGVIPYRPDFSTLLYYTNTDSTQGLSLLPKMPYNAPPLSTVEYEILVNWIQDGAPHKDGRIKFADNPTRRKFYVSNQGCDVVTVFDCETRKACLLYTSRCV